MLNENRIEMFEDREKFVQMKLCSQKFFLFI